MKRGEAFLGGRVWEEKQNLKMGRRGERKRGLTPLLSRFLPKMG